MKFNITIEMIDVTREDLQHLNSVLGPLNAVPTPAPASKEEEAPAPASKKKKSPTPKEEAPAPASKEEKSPVPASKKKSPTPKEESPKESTEVEEAPVKEEDLLDVAVKRATALLADGDTTPVKNALKVAGARRVSELRGDALVAFLDALPEED